MTECRTCREDYDEDDASAVEYHTKPVDCAQSCRCIGRPNCYTCRGSFCCCAQH